VSRVRLPRYAMPRVPKLSAGYFVQPGMDLIDLFIGSEGTLGVVVEATLHVIRRPQTCALLVECDSDEQALKVTGALRSGAVRAWHGNGPLDVAAVEYMDAHSLDVLEASTFARAGVARPLTGCGLLLVQMEVADPEPGLAALQELLDECGVVKDPVAALPGDSGGAARLFEFREAVPTAVNARIARAKTLDPEVQKTAGDMIVPFDRLGEWIARCRAEFTSRGLDYAIWGHISDGNLHPNVMPSSRAQMQSGVEALASLAGAAIAMGGAPLAEHGVGRSPLKQELLRELYGEEGIAQMRAVKRALDPTWKLAPGVLFARRAGD
jgi:D-lactate dehydrogenase (cytochrome)